MKKKERKESKKGPRVGLMRLSTKINLMFALFAVVLGVLMFYSTRIILVVTTTQACWEKAQGAAYIAANYLQDTGFETNIRTMEHDETYEHIQQRMILFRQSLNIHDLIILCPEQQNAAVYMALQSEDEESPLRTGDVIQLSEEDYEKIRAYLGQSSEPEGTVKGHSSHSGDNEVGAWAAVKDARGDLLAVVEADVLLTDVLDTAYFWIALTVFVYVIIVLVCFLVQSILTGRMIAAPLKKITTRASSFVEGDRLAGFENDIKSGDELQLLNEALSRMSQDIAAYTVRKEQIAADDQRAVTELQVAARMQDNMLPARPETFLDRYDYWLGSRFVPAPRVGGSTYDLFALDDARMAIVMYSLKATGLAAAVQLLLARAIIRSQLISRNSLREAMAEINRQLYEQLPQHDVPLRVFAGVLDGENDRLTCVNADSNPPLLMCRGQTYRFLPCPACGPMGQVENVAYQEYTVELQQGDRLLWYSDAVLEAEDGAGALLGADGLKKLLGDARINDPDELLDRLEQMNGDAEKEKVLLALECRRANRKRSSLRVEPRPENAGQVRDFIRKRLESQPLPGRDRAQLLVCAEEYFLVCCRYVQRGSVDVSCAVEGTKFLLRFAADMNGLDPFEHDAGETMDNAMQFIRKYTDGAAARLVKGCTTLTMTKDLMDRSMEG